MPDDERDDLIRNFVDLFGQCEAHVVRRMLSHFQQVDADVARRVSEGLGMATNATGTTAAEPQLAGRPLSPEA